MPYDDLIDKHANRVGIDPNWMRKIMKVESGGDPRNVTGSYKGLFQLSNREFRAGGGSGDILDPEQNTMAAANKLAREKVQFKEKYGRDPKLADLYMIHQQGEGGYQAHVSNPEQPAWQNMWSTGEGKQKGEAWAKRAIWGNIPDAAKKRFGSVENVSSKDFLDLWSNKIEGTTFETHGPFKVAKTKAEGEAKGTKRGTFLGEEPDDSAADRPRPKMDFDFPMQPVPSIQVPGVTAPGISLGSSASAPRIPGATRWEQG
jgi:Transglycosylase SLT domain